MVKLIRNMLTALVIVYSVGVVGWAMLHTLVGDRWWWMFFLNSFAPYFFVPLPLVAGWAVVARSRLVWAGTGVVALLGVWFYGGLFVPRGSSAEAAAPTLSVMEYNLLGFNTNTDGIVSAIRASNADVVGLQELNPEVAEALQHELGSDYPYQFLDPRVGVSGSGVISRYPLERAELSLPGDSWVGAEQTFWLTFDETRVLLVHFHAIPPFIGDREHMTWVIRERERQAQSIRDFASQRSEPLIVAGDLNATDMSTAHAIITDALADSWREGGYGLGHTFPGAASSGSSRICKAGVCVPQWLVRIDYVFHSDEWETVSANIGPWDGMSDHRPVQATLRLR